MATTVPSTTSAAPATTTQMINSCGANMTNDSLVSEEERQRYLEHLQDDTTISMIPALTWLVLLGVTGLVGNSLVLFVYSQKFAQTATKILILTIASFDIIANVVVVPANFHGLLHMWDFNNPPLCRLRRFTNAFVTLSSAMVLVAVAVVRYRKVCNPHGWQVTSKHAKFISVGVALLGVLVSIPYAVINGRETKKTPNPYICGYACDADDRYVNTKWPLVVNGFFLILFFAMLIPMVVMYIRIGLTAWKHNKRYGVSEVPMATMKNAGSLKSEKKCQSKSSMATPETSDTNRNCTESFDYSSEASINAGDIRNEHLSHQNKVHGLGKYRVRIVEDRVEISTPQMIELVEKIKEVTKGHEDVLGPFASVGQSESENVLGDGSKSRQTSVEIDGVETSKQNGKGDINYEDSRESTVVTNKTSDETSPVPPPRYKRAHALSKDKPQGTAEATYKSTETKSLDDDNSHDKNDTISALKWLDIIYSPEEVQDTGNDSCEADKTSLKPGASFSVRLSRTNNILEKVEILQKLIVEALAKEKAKTLPENTEENNGKADVREDQKNFMGKQNEAFTSSCDDMDNSYEGKVSVKEDKGTKERPSPVNKLKQLVAKAKPGRKNPHQDGAHRRILGRTTVMLIIISAVFIIGFVPYLAAVFFAFAAPKKFEALNMVQTSFYYLFYESFLLNSAANPIVYSLCNVNFRQECLSLFKRWSCRKSQ